MKVIVIGGGAAGFFTAINIAEKHPDYDVSILEKTNKVLQKVKVSGGGRCNVTNERTHPSELVKFYPRGNKKLHRLFKVFSSRDMVRWLSTRGVSMKAEADKRMFPTSDDSQTIIDCFLKEANKYGVRLLKNHPVKSIELKDNHWMIESDGGKLKADRIVFATGSSPATWKVLASIGLSISAIVPSLFTFNITDPRIDGLQGISFEHAEVKVAGDKLSEEGALLITHWGMSGPAILKLSAWGAYALNARDYHFDILINYVNLSSERVRQHIANYKIQHPKRKLYKYPLFDLPKRFWERIVTICGISMEVPLSDVSKKQLNKLIEELTQGKYKVHGKSTFKEEFVTAGGVSLSEVDLDTFEARRFPGLYLAGEVLDIDALTGGFNFQACWSGGWVISEAI